MTDSNNHQYGNSGTSTQTRDETLSSIWGGHSSAPTAGTSYGMQTDWSEGSLTPTPAPGPGDLGGFSATTETGAPISDLASLSAADRVTISGETMSVEVALHIGLLVRDQKSGLIRPADANEVQANESKQAQQQEQENDQEASALDDQGEAIMAEAFEAAMGETISAANDVMAGGEVSSHNIEQLATRLGVEPAEVQARVEHARAAYAHEAYSVSARRVGVSLATATAALAHARENSLGELTHAAEQHFNTGKANNDHLVRAYVENLDTIDPNYILASMGSKARWDASSQQVVVKSKRHGEIGWGAAVRAGLIKI